MTTTLHVGNMPRNSTAREIEGLFRPFGLVASVSVSQDSATGTNTGSCTVEMDNQVDAQSAVNRLNFSEFGGRTISVSMKPVR